MIPRDVQDRINYHFEALKKSNEEVVFKDTMGLREFIEDKKRKQKEGIR